MTDDPKHGDGGPDEGLDAMEIDFDSPEPGAGGEAEETPTDAGGADSADLWDDLPETEIEEGDLDSDFFADFEDVDTDLYDGIPTDEEIGAGFDRISLPPPTPEQVMDDDDDDDVLIDDDTEIEFEEGEAEGSFLDDFQDSGWGEQEWRECASRLLADARAAEESHVSARLLAEAGRVTELRLGDADEALKLYRSAEHLGGDCLAALQGIRRLSLSRGDLDEYAEAVDRETAAAATDSVP